MLISFSCYILIVLVSLIFYLALASASTNPIFTKVIILHCKLLANQTIVLFSNIPIILHLHIIPFYDLLNGLFILIIDIVALGIIANPINHLF